MALLELRRGVVDALMARPPVFRAKFEGEMVVDNFAGGGGASTGIAEAIGRPVDVAINHDEHAIEMHRRNHPETRHYREDILDVDPREVCRGRRLGAAWFSPDCTHFSRAKGRKPVSKEIRGLAWVVVNWARTVKPRVIFLENVEEFQTWGPVDDEGYPIPERAGETFREWLAELTSCGYRVEYRSLVAADYGAPTTRRRLFLVARRDGRPIVWPDATHGDGRPNAWRPAAEVIDWSLPAPSIFDRKKPLAEATLKRIATGVRRFVLEASDPFIIPVTHAGDLRAHSIRQPLRTVTGAHRGEFALVEPFVVRHGHYSKKTGAGLRSIPGGPGVFRGQPLSSPLATVCGTNDKHLVCPILSKHFGGEHANGKLKAVGADLRDPLSTVTARRNLGFTAAFLTKFYGSSRSGASVGSPVPTITGQAGGGHLGEVRAFLIKYYGAGGRAQAQSVRTPLGTVTTKDRFGLVMIHGELYQLVDIGMRMLQPHELFAAQDFPEDYVIDFDLNGKQVTKEIQTRLAGNSVCPPVARDVVAANMEAA